MKQIILLISLALTLLFPTATKAAQEFSTNFTSHYHIQPDGAARVTHTIILKNKLSYIYPTQYTLYIGSNEISDITVLQNSSPLRYSKDESENSTTLTLEDLNPVVGLDQETTLTISYFTPDIAEPLGRTWSVNIPRLARANEAETFTRIVSLPKDLGLPTAQFPEASTITSNESTGETVLTFRGFPNNSISLLFGNSEYYRADLTYHIKNPTLSAADTEIALPLDTPYQRVILDKLEPTPRNIRLDEDGNWLAVYPLKSKESLTISAVLFIEVFPLPHNEVLPPVTQTKTLLSETDYWHTHAETVKELSLRLKTPENIYNYLVENLIYNYSRVENDNTARLGSLEALSNPNSAICTEFTDSFIALARSLSVPAREVNGFAYSTNPSLRPLGLEKDVLHSWPEYYNQELSSWIQLDPTWGNTTGGIDYFHKLDFNHLAFVIHGQEPDYPYPAGAYKFEASDKTVSISLAEELPAIKETFSLTEQDGHTLITNTGNVAISNDQVAYLPPQGQAIINEPGLSLPSSFPRLYPYLIFGLILLIVLITLRKLRKSQ